MWKAGCESSWVIQRWGLESEDGLVFIQKYLAYWAWYSHSNSGAFKSTASTQEFSDVGYPFHLTKYCCLQLHPVFRSETISSTLLQNSFLFLLYDMTQPAPKRPSLYGLYWGKF